MASSRSPSPFPSNARVRRSYHFGQGGMLYVFITLLIALGAFNSQNNLLYWTFGFALALILVSGVVSGTMLMGVRVEREWISSASAGETVRIRYRVGNINRLFPAFALTIVEEGFDGPPERPRLLARLLGARPAALSKPRIFLPPRAFVAHVGPGETIHTEARVMARHRGAASFSALVVSTSFPFGLMRKIVRIPRHGATVISPHPAPVELELADGGRRTGHSGFSARRSGRGEEFFALREYIHGDSPRDVAWRASAKRGSLLVRQFAAPAPHRLWIILHLRTRPGSDADDEQAIRVGAGLARLAESRSVEYALAVPLHRLLVHPRRGVGHLSRLMMDLGLLDLGADDGRGTRCAFPPQATGMGSSCVVVHAGSMDPGFAPRSAQITHIEAHGAPENTSPVAAIHPIRVEEGAPRAA